jgi:hypothetical protein
MTDDDQTNNPASSERDSALERSSDRGGERELSNGKRDRSRDMLREELTRNLDDAARRSGRPRDWEPADRPAREAREAAAEKPRAKDGGQETPGIAAAPGGADVAPDISSPPARLTKGAKEKWHALGKLEEGKFWQGEIHKINTDAQKGYDEREKVHEAENAAWAPWEPALRQASVSRAQAVSNFMSWHDYLRRDPLAAFPALVKSIGAEPAFRELLQRQQAGAQPQAQQDPFQQYAASVEQRLNGFQQTIAQQEEARQQAHANAVIEDFKRGREHFETVRSHMASLIAGGVIPLRNGAVDLSAAYEAAVRMLPDTFEQTVAERIAAEKKKQRDYADRARRSSASLSVNAPGSNNSIGAKKRVGGKSVRASIEEALEEASGR